MMPYESLKAWQASMSLWVEIFRATEHWPKREWYGLAAQIRKAALSAGSNIAEGTGKRGPREMARYLDIALGSLSEVSHQLRAARAVGMLDEAEFERLSALQQSAGKLTWLLLASLRKRCSNQ
jgi:four helix bundle protein